MNISKAALIILNYNSYDETINLVQSIRMYEMELVPYIIIIDNASKDANMLKERCPTDCELILLNDNNGYAAGNNVGIKRAIELGFEYIVIANSDTEILEKNTIKKLLYAMEFNNACIIGPGILNADNNMTSGAGKVSIFGKVHEKLDMNAKLCQCLVGAFFVIKKEVFDKIGFIKEDYFLYLEETDFFYRAYINRINILYYPFIKIKHYEGTTTSKIYDYYISRNRFELAENNFQTPHIIMCVYLFIEFIITDLKQAIACKLGIRNYDYKYRRKLRWQGYYDGIKKIKGKKNF